MKLASSIQKEQLLWQQTAEERPLLSTHLSNGGSLGIILGQPESGWSNIKRDGQGDVLNSVKSFCFFQCYGVMLLLLTLFYKKKINCFSCVK